MSLMLLMGFLEARVPYSQTVLAWWQVRQVDLAILVGHRKGCGFTDHNEGLHLVVDIAAQHRYPGGVE